MGKKIASVFFPTGNARDDALRRRLEQAGETSARLQSEALLDRLDAASRKLDSTIAWIASRRQAASQKGANGIRDDVMQKLRREHGADAKIWREPDGSIRVRRSSRRLSVMTTCGLFG